MNRDEMVKMSFRPYMVLHYRHQRMESDVECILIAVDFDNEVFTLQPIDEIYEQKDFVTSIDNVFKPRKKFKLKST